MAVSFLEQAGAFYRQSESLRTQVGAFYRRIAAPFQASWAEAQRSRANTVRHNLTQLLAAANIQDLIPLSPHEIRVASQFPGTLKEAATVFAIPPDDMEEISKKALIIAIGRCDAILQGPQTTLDLQRQTIFRQDELYRELNSLPQNKSKKRS